MLLFSPIPNFLAKKRFLVQSKS